jgi:hypothetical protein
MMIPRVLFLNVNLEANIPPNIREDVASKPNRNAYNIVVKRASGATSPKRFVFGPYQFKKDCYGNLERWR